MNQTDRQKLSLLSTMNDIAECVAAKEPLPPQNYADFKEALKIFAVPEENRMVALATALAAGDTSVGDEFCRFFERFYDAQVSAISARTPP